MGGILPTSPPKLGKGRITNQHVTGMSVSQLLSGSLLGQLQVVADPQNSPANKSPGLKRARSNNRRRSQSKAVDEPLLDIKLPEGNGPWQGIVVTLRHGKYKGKSAHVLGLAKKKYLVQVEGLDYQLEFYPSYVGLPEPTPQDSHSAATDTKSAATGATAAETAALMAQGKHLIQRIPSGGSSAAHIIMASPGCGGLSRMISSDSNNTNCSKPTSLDGYRSWIGKKVKVKRGKYQGRYAWVLGLACEKLRVVVENVEHQLEYYPTMFEPPQETDQPAPQLTGDPLPTVPTITARAQIAHCDQPVSSNTTSKPAMNGIIDTGHSDTGLTQAMCSLPLNDGSNAVTKAPNWGQSNESTIDTTTLEMKAETLVNALQPSNLLLDSAHANAKSPTRRTSTGESGTNVDTMLSKGAVELLADGQWKGASTESPMAPLNQPPFIKPAVDLVRMETGGSVTFIPDISDQP